MYTKVRRIFASHWSRNLSRRSASCVLAALTWISALFLSNLQDASAANAEKDVNNGQADLTASATYTPAGAPTSTSDVTFKSGTTYSPATFTASSSVTMGTLNDLDGTQTLTITNSGSNNTTGTITLNGGGDTVTGSASGDLIFLAANSLLTIQNGNGQRHFQVTLNANGNFDVSSGATLTISCPLVGNFNLTKTGVGTLTLSGVNTFGSGNTFTLSAGTLNINSATALGAATDTFQINGGTTIDNTSGASVTLSNNNPLTINGDFTFTGSNALNLGTGATSLGAAAGTSRTITVSASTLTVGGVIGNGTTANSLTKAGSGTLVLSGANTYTGGTSVSGGSLFVNNTTGSGTGTGNITVTGSGTTLGGSGTMTGQVSVASGNNLAPGASGVGSTAILKTGALTLSSGSNFQVDINGTTVGTGYDQLAVTGGVLHITGSHLLVSVGAVFTQANVGAQFAILSNITAGMIDNGTETFSGLSEGARFNSGSDQFMITYFGNAGDGTNGNDIVLTLTAVPEPSTWATGALALASLIFIQRRRISRLVRRS